MGIARAQEVPGAPRFLSAQAPAGTPNVRFDWQPPLDGAPADSYRLEIGRLPGAGDAGTIEVGNVLTYTTGLAPGGYFARVRARNGAAVGPASNEVSFVVTCGQTEIGPPRAVTYRWASSNRLELTWSDPAGFLEGLIGFRVDVGAAPQTTFQSFTVGTSATWFTLDVSSLIVRSSVYYVRVSTINQCGPSRSTEEFALTWPPPPSSSDVVINEFGPFLELRNRSNAPVDIGGWRVHMSLFNGNRSYLRKVIDSGVVLNAGCAYLLAPQDGYAFPAVPPDATMPETDADGIALARPNGSIADQVARRPRSGRPASPYQEGRPINSDADTVPLGQTVSYARAPGGVDSDDNQADFVLQAPPTPEPRQSCRTEPGPPRDLMFTVTGGTVTLSWSPPIGSAPGQTYIIEAGTRPGDASLARFLTAASTGSVTSVPMGTYYVRVRAAGALVSGPASNEVVITVCGLPTCPTPPGPPRQLAAFVSGTNVTLSWLAPAHGPAVIAYVLEAGAGPGIANVGVFEFAATTTVLSVASVPPGSYFVRIRARSAGGLGAPSNENLVNVPQ